MSFKVKFIGFSTLFLLIMGTIVALGVRTRENNVHYETATVVSVRREDSQIVRFETSDSHLWDEEFDYEDSINIGDKAVLTFKNDDTETYEDDIVIDVEFKKE